MAHPLGGRATEWAGKAPAQRRQQAHAILGEHRGDQPRGWGGWDSAGPAADAPSFPAERLQLRVPDDNRGAVPGLCQDGLLQGGGLGCRGERGPLGDPWGTPTQSFSAICPQGNIVAVKHLNRKRIELTRKVLFELKHVGTRGLGGGRHIPQLPPQLICVQLCSSGGEGAGRLGSRAGSGGIGATMCPLPPAWTTPRQHNGFHPQPP